MQHIVIELALPRDKQKPKNTDLTIGPGIASLVGLKYLPEDFSMEFKQKFRNAIDLQNFKTNFLQRHPDQYVHICEMRGLDGYDIEEINENREEVYNEIYKKYGNDTKIVFHIDEHLTQWKFFPLASHIAKQFFEENITMYGFIFEPNFGMIECELNSLSTRGFNVPNVKHFTYLFRDHNIMPKELLIYNANHAVNRSEIRSVYEKYFNRYNIKIMEPSPTFWYLTAAGVSNAPYLRDSTLLQDKLDKIEMIYSNKDYKFTKTFNCLNNKPRTYRIQFLADLDAEGLLDDTEWSLGFSTKHKFNWGDKRKLPMEFLAKYSDVLPKAIEDDVSVSDPNDGFLGIGSHNQQHGEYSVFHEMEGRDLIIDPFYTYHAMLGRIKFALVTETYGYHLVDETWSDEKHTAFMQSNIPDDFPVWDFDRTLLSEKTFKMIACGIPAFCMDTRYTVKHFKQLGFKFPWADMADYDNVRKFNKRSKKLVSELHKFKDIDTKQFVEAIQYNTELFFNSERIAEEMYKPFYEWVNND